MRFIKRKEIVNPEFKIDFFSLLFSSGLFSGFFPVASGTFASGFALLFLLIPGFNNYYILTSTILLCFIVGIFTSGKMTKRYGHDPSVVVIDEIVGMWITLLITGFFYDGYLYLIICFLSFRFFDIVKIYPASFFDKMKSGFGIMMDDVIAGVYAGAVSIVLLFMLYKLL